MAEAQPEVQAAETPVPQPQPSNGQLTSTTPTTQRKKDPNLKRQTAGKAAAEKTREAREIQKKELEDSRAIIAKYKAKEAAAVASRTSGQEAASDDSKDEKSFPFGTVLALGSLLVGVAALYYQREAMQKSKSSAPKSKESAPSPRVPSEPALAAQRKGGIRKMD